MAKRSIPFGVLGLALAAAPATAGAQTQAAPTTNPLRVDANGYPRYDVAFAQVYNGNAPVTIDGTVVRADFGEPKSVLWVYGAGTTPGGGVTDPQLWQIEGGSASSLDAEVRASAQADIGDQVTARGYYAFNPNCDLACLVNGRAVIKPDGSQMFDMTGRKPDCTQDQRVNHTCASAQKPSPDFQPPGEAEIRAALARAGKTGNITFRSFTSNAVKRGG